MFLCLLVYLYVCLSFFVCLSSVFLYVCPSIIPPLFSVNLFVFLPFFLLRKMCEWIRGKILRNGIYRYLYLFSFFLTNQTSWYKSWILIRIMILIQIIIRSWFVFVYKSTQIYVDTILLKMKARSRSLFMVVKMKKEAINY